MASNFPIGNVQTIIYSVSSFSKNEENKISMKLIEWNIRHGGSKRIPGIIESLAHHNPDIVILTEYRWPRN
jgi:hypothetical protein